MRRGSIVIVGAFCLLAASFGTLPAQAATPDAATRCGTPPGYPDC